MKKEFKMFLLRYLLICSIVLLPSCMRDSDECICTKEFRTVTVYVIDDMNNPVENLVTTIMDENGKEYGLSEPPFFTGYYSVMTDVYVNDFTIHPKKILFEGIKDSLTVNAEFFINTDECNCHINKVSGPDTLVLN